MPKQTRETIIEGREESNTCIYETNKFNLCYVSGGVSTN